MDAHGLVGTPCRTDHRAPGLFIDQRMVFEGIDRIVGGAHDFHVHRFQKRKRFERIRCKFRVDFVPDPFRIVRTKNIGDAEPSAEIKVNPFKNRVAGDLRHNAGEFHPFLFRCSGSGDVLLLHSAFAHDFPDIVVGRGEHFPRIRIICIRGDLRNIGVIVRINDRKILHRVVNRNGGFAFQQILVVKKRHLSDSFQFWFDIHNII